jgi:hypothetical protein
MTEPSNWRFPTVCPACFEMSGNPLRLDSSAGELIIVWVRCDCCQFQWRITAATPPLILKPKPDRRAAD